MTFDPYTELGVERDATEADVRKAFRRRAKQTHPDTENGNAEAFRRASRSLAVLTDPAKRKTYDETGRLEDDKPDTTAVAAGQLIEQFFGNLLNNYLQNFDKVHDPRYVDIIAACRKHVTDDLGVVRFSIGRWRQAADFHKDMIKRLSRKKKRPGRDVLLAMFDRQVAHALAQEQGAIEGIKVRELALKLLDDYEFKFDPRPADAQAQPQPGVFSFRLG